MSKPVYIFTGPVHTGKTTILQKWIEGKSVRGLLSPVENGLRIFQNARDKDTFPFEVVGNDEKDFVKVGSYRFYNRAFEQARELILSEMVQPCEWLIIDEIGKLEMDRIGLEPAASKVISDYKANDPAYKLMVVVRNSLVRRFLLHYEIIRYEIVSKFDIDQLS